MLEYKSICAVVTNQKGGVGKTTFAELIGEWLAVCVGLNVLGVDLDMQGNYSSRYIEMDSVPNDSDNESGMIPPAIDDYDPEEDTHITNRSNIADIFDGLMCEARPTQFSPDNENERNRTPGLIDVMLAHPTKLEQINGRFTADSSHLLHQVINRLQQVLHMDHYAEMYDIILIDTAPTRTPLFRAAMRAATHIVIPFLPEAKSVQGLLAMFGAYRSEVMQRDGDRTVEIAALVPNNVRRGTDHMAVLREMVSVPEYARYLPPLSKKDDTRLFIPQTTEVSKRGYKHIKPDSIFKLSRNNPMRQDIELVMLSVARRLFAEHPALSKIEAYADKTDYLSADRLSPMEQEA